MPDSLTFLLDFDGTITTRDMSVELVKAFVKPEDLEKARGPWDPRDWFTAMAALLPRDKDRLIRYVVDTYELRSGFMEFVDWARTKDYGLAIATDGFGFYVEPLLRACSQGYSRPPAQGLHAVRHMQGRLPARPEEYAEPRGQAVHRVGFLL